MFRVLRYHLNLAWSRFASNLGIKKLFLASGASQTQLLLLSVWSAVWSSTMTGFAGKNPTNQCFIENLYAEYRYNTPQKALLRRKALGTETAIPLLVHPSLVTKIRSATSKVST